MQFRLAPDIALVRGYKKLLTYFHSDQIIAFAASLSPNINTTSFVVKNALWIGI
jgi:hypothetical protein